MINERETPDQFMDSLAIHLEVPVVLNLAHLQSLSTHLREVCIETWRSEAAQAIATFGDALQFKTKKPDTTAAAFIALAKGVAALATQPGGFHFAGRHWTTKTEVRP